MKCRICGEISDVEIYRIAEMMYGTGAIFDYFQCRQCHCLQIKDIPSDLAQYYPSDYYAYSKYTVKKKTALIDYLKIQRGKLLTKGSPLVRALVRPIIKPPMFYDWLAVAKVQLNDKILDVGSGSGVIPLWLRSEGFANILGIDPYISHSLRYQDVEIQKCEVSDLNETFDFIMLNHSFEHTAHPEELLIQLNARIKSNHYVLIRTPVASSYAWEHYREHWVQIDAPRHLHIHTPTSMRILAAKTGFRVQHIIYDSTEFQFTGSELYRKGVGLRSAEPDGNNASIKRSLRRQAKQLNNEQRGDQACFYLLKL
jgi:hypothetical protein